MAQPWGAPPCQARRPGRQRASFDPWLAAELTRRLCPNATVVTFVHRERVAVEVGFEPTEELPPHTLSRRAPSAARTLHRGRDYPRSPPPRCAPKNVRSSSPHSSASTPATTSGRWLRRRSRTTSHSDPA